MIRVTGGLVILLFLLTAQVQATPVSPVSYDMPNGYGQASGGTFNYWDRFYTGAGATTTDGAPLSGGLGDLTDGLSATDNWFNVENVAGMGPYVGWLSIDPTITFHFIPILDFDTVRIHFDDADGAGGVSAPLSVIINGTTFPVVDPAGAAPFFAEFDLSNLMTNQLTLQLVRGDLWVFASEFAFTTVTAVVPEPSSFMLMGLGSVVLASLIWHRKTRG